MGEKDLKQPLTAYDKFTVYLYRSGIVLATACMVYAAYFFYLNAYGVIFPEFFSNNYPVIIFWLFVICVNLSVGFLHLYSKKILKIIKAFTVAGTSILIVMALSHNLDYMALFESNGWRGKVGILGLGLVLAGFSGIGAKEAFCFRLYEGYAYGICLAILTILHLIGVVSSRFGFIFSFRNWRAGFNFYFAKIILTASL